jgi:hypothetical protein
MTNNHELASRNGLTAERSLEPFAERRKCAKSGHWAPLIVTSAIRPKRTKRIIESNGKNKRSGRWAN